MELFRYSGMLVVLIAIVIEFVIGQKEQKHLYKKKEVLENILIGLGLFFITIFSKALMYVCFDLMYAIRLFTIHPQWVIFLMLFLLSDLSFYWFHRTSHSVGWFWSSHYVHHSAKQYNLLVSFRQSWTGQISGQPLFWMWLPFLGFGPSSVYIAYAIGLIYQSWLHTELIGKLHPVFEFIFNTPSHHRVHHGSNVKYLDKNLGGIFIFWDRMFGTFQKEEEKPDYGLTDKKEFNSVTSLMFHGWKDLFRKVHRAKNIFTKLKYLFKPPGWSHDGSSKTVKQMRQESN